MDPLVRREPSTSTATTEAPSSSSPNLSEPDGETAVSVLNSIISLVSTFASSGPSDARSSSDVETVLSILDVIIPLVSTFVSPAPSDPKSSSSSSLGAKLLTKSQVEPILSTVTLDIAGGGASNGGRTPLIPLPLSTRRLSRAFSTSS
ncbi:hypothetical protein HanXRQr2_Chr11g0486371 [Helianthus annuus]|uniref:Uncharacterized protein n=1 Tax=Helianthus annuus TaxID=4232 RepID=A0A9K3HNL6_HELAN|nr:hypothetical protein HanXRQr2_Chr11g0486371 [Helianthus annuus]KAJ0874795.1 hypothetical protein HanPSC8_Chr11g0468491 [Helianthus annuus]